MGKGCQVKRILDLLFFLKNIFRRQLVPGYVAVCGEISFFDKKS
jgi:hypothetical protein